jgi:NADPH:quinone reductase-like Zn-dependent oxidoreductase
VDTKTIKDRELVPLHNPFNTQTFQLTRQSIMPTHTLFRLAHRNGFDAFEPRTEDIPTIDRHELLIKVRSVALNYRDVAIATSKYPFSVKDNLVPCSDMIGEVHQVGEMVPGFNTGDRVVVAFDPTALYGTIDNWDNALGGPKDGVLAEYVRVSYEAAVKIPEGSSQSDAQWASLVCTGVTAWNSLYGNKVLKPGQTVLFQGMLSTITHLSTFSR